MISEILNKHQSDKVTHHSYSELYDEIFAPYKESATHILELGIENGCSLRAFKEYFTKAEIIGLEKEAHKLFNEERITTYHLDTTERDRFIAIAKTLPQCDMILDDGSHVLNEQLFAVAVLWNTLKVGGVFIVEDIYAAEYLDAFDCFVNVEKYNFDKCGSDRVVVIRKLK